VEIGKDIFLTDAREPYLTVTLTSRDLLAHRLWIKQHAAEATSAELDAACAAIEQSDRLMQAQLARLDAIAAELAAAQSSARTVAPRGKTTAS